jgi:hypothetical protein
MIMITTDTRINTELSTPIFFLCQLKFTAICRKGPPRSVMAVLGLSRKPASQLFWSVVLILCQRASKKVRFFSLSM